MKKRRTLLKNARILWIITLTLLVCALPTPVSAAPASPQVSVPRQTRELVKKIDSSFKELQSRRGGPLEARLTEIWQAIVASEPDIEKYARENPRRHGAAIYAEARGESGLKYVTLIFYRPEEMPPLEGRVGSRIKEWFFTQPIAQNLAKKTAAALQIDPSATFRVSQIPPEQGVGIVLSPNTGNPLPSPILGESLFQK